MKLRNKKQFRTSCGFTLIELMVVFGISAIIAAVIVGKYPDFSSKIEFENTTLDVALAIREAQVYGVGAKETSISTSKFDVSYGVHFDMNKPNELILFTDNITANNIYDVGEELEILPIKNGFRIKDICKQPSVCYSTVNSRNPLDVTFKRPNPDATIKLNNVDSTFGSIEIENIKTGKTKTIKVTNTGQISVI
jgi:prepilin-type N-terminal cleavage/methylation domain-containing protein